MLGGFVSGVAILALAGSTLAAQTWDGLRVTWDLNPFDSHAFDPLPRDLNHDDMKGFVFKDDQCTGAMTFQGKRFWKDNDPAVMLLYDVNGFISGIQTGIPKSKFTPPDHQKGYAFMDDGDYWTLTIYTVDPLTICAGGRSQEEYDMQGTGNQVWIQNGTRHSIKIPLTEGDIRATHWTLGHCFVTMGVHYWYNVTTDMSCDDFFPFFLLYNKGKLNACGFALNADLSSKRYEHPPHSVIGQFMKPVPTCFSTDPAFAKLSTMHVYFTDWPRTTCLC